MDYLQRLNQLEVENTAVSNDMLDKLVRTEKTLLNALKHTESIVARTGDKQAREKIKGLITKKEKYIRSLEVLLLLPDDMSDIEVQ
jgi:DNA-binding ferritin-like protein